MSFGLIKMSKEIIRLRIYRMSSKILWVIYTFGSFTFSHFIPRTRDAIRFPLQPEWKSLLSILANLSNISSSSWKASLQKMRREEETVCQALALAASSFVSGHYPVEGISNTTTTCVIADGVEISLQVLNYSAGIFEARQLHSCRLQGSLVTLHNTSGDFRNQLYPN